MPVTLLAGVSRPGSYPNAMFFGALFGTENHKTLGDIGVGDRQTDSWEQKVPEKAGLSVGVVVQLLSLRKKVYLPFLTLLYINCLYMKALETALNLFVLARA